MRSVELWQASTILNHSAKGQHFGFDYSLNPYRGCSHACRYCYARDSHTFLDLNVAEDFERRLYVKENLAVRMKEELKKIPLNKEIAIGTVTDPYQPLEGRHHLTRTAIMLLKDSGHRFTITTKSPLIERDLDVLAGLGERQQAGVHISLISLDRSVLQMLEPGTAPPQRRLTTIRRLKDAGMTVGVFIAPIIPYLTDGQEVLEPLFSAIREAHADWVMTSTPRLSPTVKEFFLKELAKCDPSLAERISELYQSGGQYVPHSYHAHLRQTLDDLRHRYHLSSSSPRLVSFEPQKQMRWMFS